MGVYDTVLIVFHVNPSVLEIMRAVPPVNSTELPKNSVLLYQHAEMNGSAPSLAGEVYTL